MNSKFCLALVSVLVLIFSSQFDQAKGQAIVFGSNNSGASNSGCNCILLSQCLSLYTPGQRLTFRQASEIRRRRCGFRQNNLLVCCPNSRVVTSPPTTTTTPPPPTHPTTLPLRCGQPTTIDKILGIQAPLGAHPWMVALGYRGPRVVRQSSIRYKCGGSLITTHHVLTAAHCVHPNDIGSEALVQLNVGDWNTQTDPDCTEDGFGNRQCAPPVQVRFPEVITWHPQYHSNLRHNNDIAVIRLNEPVQLNFFVRPICIPGSFSNNGAGYSNPVATGWGTTAVSDFADILQQVRLPFADFSRCNSSFNGLLSERQLCAGGEEGKDTCFGDSGGPLVAGGTAGPPFQLVGLTSFGKGFCGRENNFGVYTVVADFRDWIEDSLKN